VLKFVLEFALCAIGVWHARIGVEMISEFSARSVNPEDESSIRVTQVVLLLVIAIFMAAIIFGVLAISISVM
jgi:hypothetical protein